MANEKCSKNGNSAEPPPWLNDAYPAVGEPDNGLADDVWKLYSANEETEGVAADIQWLVDGEVAENALWQIYSTAKAGKTFSNIDLAARITREDLNWFGLPLKHGPIVYLILEGQGHFRLRLRAWRQINGKFGEFHFLDVPVGFLEEADIGKLISTIAPVKPVAVFVDTVARSLQGGNENSPDDMGAFVAACDQIRYKLNCAVIVLHHSGWEKGRSRGHSSLNAACDVVGRIEVLEDGKTRKYSTDVSRDSDASFKTFFFSLTSVNVPTETSFVKVAVVEEVAGPTDDNALGGEERIILATLRDRYGRKGNPTTTASRSEINAVIDEHIGETLIEKAGGNPARIVAAKDAIRKRRNRIFSFLAKSGNIKNSVAETRYTIVLPKQSEDDDDFDF